MHVDAARGFEDALERPAGNGLDAVEESIQADGLAACGVIHMRTRCRVGIEYASAEREKIVDVQVITHAGAITPDPQGLPVQRALEGSGNDPETLACRLSRAKDV